MPTELRNHVLARCLVGLTGFSLFVFTTKILPLSICGIIQNTAPFWTAILSYRFMGDVISRVELVCMIGCFVGVVVLMLAKDNPSSPTAEAKLDVPKSNSTTSLFDISKEIENTKTAAATMPRFMYLIGIVTMFVNSWCFAFVGVITRLVKQVHFSVMLFWYALVASTILFLGLAVEHVAEHGFGSCPRLLSYSSKMYSLIFVASIFNAVGMNFATIAWQAEKSAFIALVGYVSVLYSFVIDLAVFGHKFEQ